MKLVIPANAEKQLRHQRGGGIEELGQRFFGIVRKK
jgi:hypothetical protein